MHSKKKEELWQVEKGQLMFLKFSYINSDFALYFYE